MKTEDFSVSILVDQSPEQVFAAVTNVRGWWSEEIEGGTSQLNDVYVYHYKDVHYCKIKLVEVVPNERVVWEVLDNNFSFVADKSEWIGNRMVFDISAENDKTKLVFTQYGLTPAYECFDVCNEAWTNYIRNSLYKLITTGKGDPNPKEGKGYNAELAEKFQIQ